VQAPTSQCKQRGSPEMYTTYIALMCDFFVKNPCSFKEEMQKSILVDDMEEYDSIVRNSVWDVVPRLEDK